MSEFIRIYQELHPFGDAEKYARLAFNAFDRDKSGRVSLAEYLIATCGVFGRKDDRERVVDLAFDIYDQNRNGTIERSEIETVVRAIYDLEGFDSTQAENKIDELFKSKHNSSLTKEEFINLIMSDSVMSRVFVYC